MDSATYGYGGGPIPASSTQASSGIYPIEPRRATPPGDQPGPDADRPRGTFRDSWYSEWSPSPPDDPHDEPYSTPSGDGDDGGYGDENAAVASNIIVDPPGPVSRSRL
jgi:hypothetical protein